MKYFRSRPSETRWILNEIHSDSSEFRTKLSEILSEFHVDSFPQWQSCLSLWVLACVDPVTSSTRYGGEYAPHLLILTHSASLIRDTCHSESLRAKGAKDPSKQLVAQRQPAGSCSSATFPIASIVLACASAQYAWQRFSLSAFIRSSSEIRVQRSHCIRHDIETYKSSLFPVVALCESYIYVSKESVVRLGPLSHGIRLDSFIRKASSAKAGLRLRAQDLPQYPSTSSRS